MDNRSVEVLVVWYVTAIATLLILWFLGRVQAAGGSRFVLAGCVLALAALCYGLLGNTSDRQGIPAPSLISGLAETALRLAAILVLGGVVVTLLGRDPARSTATTSEATTNVPPGI
jgi:hypothetical protein